MKTNFGNGLSDDRKLHPEIANKHLSNGPWTSLRKVHKDNVSEDNKQRSGHYSGPESELTSSQAR
jgi:hypothetical protein